MGKGQKERVIPFGDRTARALLRYLNLRANPRNHPQVFLNLDGELMTEKPSSWCASGWQPPLKSPACASTYCATPSPPLLCCPAFASNASYVTDLPPASSSRPLLRSRSPTCNYNSAGILTSGLRVVANPKTTCAIRATPYPEFRPWCPPALLRRPFVAETVPHPGLGDQVAGRGRVILQLLADAGDEYP